MALDKLKNAQTIVFKLCLCSKSSNPISSSIPSNPTIIFNNQTIFGEFKSKQHMQNAQSQYEKKMMQEAQKQQIEEQRQALLIQLLTPEAKERLMKIKTVKPEKAVGIQNSLLKAYQSGMLKNRVTENDLVTLLERDSQARGSQKITFKRHGLDDEW